MLHSHEIRQMVTLDDKPDVIKVDENRRVKFHEAGKEFRQQ